MDTEVKPDASVEKELWIVRHQRWLPQWVRLFWVKRQRQRIGREKYIGAHNKARGELTPEEKQAALQKARQGLIDAGLLDK